MDKGAQKSVSGLNAYLRYRQHAHVNPKILPSRYQFRFRVDGHKSLRTAKIRMPIDTRYNFREYTTNITSVDVPMLFGLDKMKEVGWYTNEV